MKKNLQPKIILNIEYVREKPSPAWRRLWDLLLADRKASEANTHKAGDGEMRNENDTNVQNL